MNDTMTSTVTTTIKGTWQETLSKSEAERVKGANSTKKASALLWTGAKVGIETWLPESTTDVSAEGFYAEVMEALGGKHRKGDASKIKTVALAVKNNGLSLAAYPNLSKAYNAALALTKVADRHAEEDEAAESATQMLKDNAPKTAATPESAAKIVLAQGVDEAARLLLDALGQTNEAAHRALLRAISNEIAGRVKPVVKTVKAGPKAGATQATAGASTVKAPVKGAASKPKPVPVSASKGDPNAKALPPKAPTAKDGESKGQPVKRPAVKRA